MRISTHSLVGQHQGDHQLQRILGTENRPAFMELINTISEEGLRKDIVVHPDGHISDGLELLMAAAFAGLKTVPVKLHPAYGIFNIAETALANQQNVLWLVHNQDRARNVLWEFGRRNNDCQPSPYSPTVKCENGAELYIRTASSPHWYGLRFHTMMVDVEIDDYQEFDMLRLQGIPHCDRTWFLRI